MFVWYNSLIICIANIKYDNARARMYVCAHVYIGYYRLKPCIVIRSMLCRSIDFRRDTMCHKRNEMLYICIYIYIYIYRERERESINIYSTIIYNREYILYLFLCILEFILIDTAVFIICNPVKHPMRS